MPAYVDVFGIQAEVMADGYRKGSGFGSGPWRQIRYKVPWENSDNFIDALLGSTNQVSFRGALFPVPHAYWNNDILKCVNAEVVEAIGPGRPGTDGKHWSCDFAVVETLYRTLDYPVDPSDTTGGQGQFGGSTSPFGRASIRYGMRTYDVPPGALVYEDDEPYTGSQPMKLIMNTIDYVFSFEMYPGIPHDLYRTLANTVNNAAFWGAPKGTLLFIPGSCDPVKSPDGRFLSSAEFTLSWQPEDHNAVIGEETGEWVIVKKADGTYTYPYADFSVLI